MPRSPRQPRAATTLPVALPPRRCTCTIRHFATEEGGYWYEEYTCPEHTKDPLAEVERALAESRCQIDLLES